MLWLMVAMALFVLVPVSLNSIILKQEDIFLRNLGLSSKPNPVSPPPIPPILWKIFNQRLGIGRHKKKPNMCFVEELNVPGSTIRVFPDNGRQVISDSAKAAPPLCLQKRLFFNVSVMEKVEKVTLSQLEVHFRQHMHHGKVFDLRLYQILKVPFKGVERYEPKRHIRKLLKMQTFSLPRRNLYINLTEVCDSWRDTNTNLGLDLEIFPQKGGSLVPTSLEDCKGNHPFAYTTLLTVTLNSLHCKKIRKKRSYGKIPSTSGDLCKKSCFYVKFKDVGWQNWVVAPSGYMANYCHGNCPFSERNVQNLSRYPNIQNKIHSKAQNSPLCHCAPIKMSPVPMLFYDNEDNVVLGQYENLVVDECGCR
ncbi:protein DVR-1-like [Spea bombifrons]|uniref:protein DVR-1-like n=1 Tax=Spea bombifrons TaxID=233779 RepID=UPI00234B8FC6|nr:protein DVR-1-like [Spea bombifrons]